MDQLREEKILRLARNVYFAVALGYVGYGFLGTLQKVVNNRIIQSVTEHEFHRFRYPSITFCYPFIDVGKDVKQIVLRLENDQGEY